jgi:hypothetical protein
LDLIAFTTRSDSVESGGPFRGGSADETPRSVTPGEEFKVRVHVAQATNQCHLEKIWFESHSGDPWKIESTPGAIDPAAPVTDQILHVRAAENAEPTQPYFTRPSIEQPYYDLTRPEYRLRSFAPYPLEAWAEFTFDGLPIRVGQVVQTMQRVQGSGRRLRTAGGHAGNRRAHGARGAHSAAGWQRRCRCASRSIRRPRLMGRSQLEAARRAGRSGAGRGASFT